MDAELPRAIQPHGALLVARPADLCIVRISENCNQVLGRPPHAWVGRPIEDVVGPKVGSRLRASISRDPFTTPQLVGAAGGVEIAAHLAGDRLIVEIDPYPVGRAAWVPPPDLLKRAASRIEAADTIDRVLAIATRELALLAGCERFVALRLGPAGAGQVVAEHLGVAGGSWLGKHVPAELLPRVGLARLARHWVRVVCDTTAAPSRVLPDAEPVDPSGWVLRAPSPAHVARLVDLGAAAAITVAIRAGDRLWGLATGFSARPLRFSYAHRAAVESIGRWVSDRMTAFAEVARTIEGIRRRDIHRQLARRVAARGPAGLIDGEPTLTEGIRAIGAAVFDGVGWLTTGRVPPGPALDGVCALAAARLLHDDAAVVDAGCLAARIGPGPRDVALWFRVPGLHGNDFVGNQDELPGPPPHPPG
ncbi:MAG: GAF domain-containing protein, partial [Myxococcota bacterium]